LEEKLHSESDLTLEHTVDRPTQFMSQNAQSCACIMFFRQAGQKFLALGVVTQEERGRFGKGPREVGLPIFFPEVPKRLPPDSLLHVTRRA
jgi:hypothetical protein